MSEETTVETAEAGKRPMFLTVICVLSFIGAGFAIIGYVTAITLMGAAGAAMSAMEGMEALTSAGPSAGMTWAYVIVGFLTTIVALFGVIKMWKLKKQGFMLYAGANVASVIMGIIYSGFGIGGMVMPIVFIVLFYLNLKHMND
jgi:hypothetical protein